MSIGDWRDDARRTLGAMFHDPLGHESKEERRSSRITTALLLVHAGEYAVQFSLPVFQPSGHWRVLIETVDPACSMEYDRETFLNLQSYSAVFLEWRP